MAVSKVYNIFSRWVVNDGKFFLFFFFSLLLVADQFIMMNDDSYHWPSIEEGENAIFGVSSASPLKAALSKPPLLQMPDLMQQNPTSKSDGAKLITCAKCGRQYKLKSSLLNHQRWECGKEPQFKCVLCNYKAKQKVHLVTHMRYKHALKPDVFSLKWTTTLAPKFRRWRGTECALPERNSWGVDR